MWLRDIESDLRPLYLPTHGRGQPLENTVDGHGYAPEEYATKREREVTSGCLSVRRVMSIHSGSDVQLVCCLMAIN